MTMDQPRVRRGLLAPSLFVLSAVAVLLSLGTWQVERKAWKEDLVEKITRRLSAPPSALPAPVNWPLLSADGFEYRRVAFRAELLNDREALVYTAGSAFRSDVSGPGYWVLTPARLPDGAIVVVNRGFVPEAQRDPATRTPAAGAVDIVGVTEARGVFTPRDDPTRNIFFTRDPASIAAMKSWGAVAPFYVEQEAPPAPGGFPQVGRIEPKLPNNHLGYAITWYGLALMLIGVFVFWLRGGGRGA
jgi:surfeit locus 1 family protein